VNLTVAQIGYRLSCSSSKWSDRTKDADHHSSQTTKGTDVRRERITHLLALVHVW
jgi:hypothetical protein